MRWPGTVCGGGSGTDSVTRYAATSSHSFSSRVVAAAHLLAVGLLRPQADERDHRRIHRRQRHQRIAHLRVADVDRQPRQADVEKVGGDLGAQPGTPRVVGIDSAQSEDHFFHDPNLADAPIRRSWPGKGMPSDKFEFAGFGTSVGQAVGFSRALIPGGTHVPTTRFRSTFPDG